ncbi:GerAB/ArcD/ProY family transporter [Paenibacillus glycanilyticus]|uniref:GerAB/ArcD/ProY family transporter n=1 Tax=Paenibacillus glycanilyticus TaxID=126569 RepID=UPI000FD6CA97|nr:endospore germination permease [Paenibacillus glycanilyticus]
MKISSWQLFWILTTLEISMSIWLTVSPTIEIARQDAWISLVVAGIIGLALSWVLVKVSQRHASQTLIEFAQTLFGKWLGKLIGVLYLLVWYSVCADILRIFSLFIKQVLFHDTPMWIISMLMMIAMAYIALVGSVEAIARFSEMAGPLLLLGILITFILNISNLRLTLMLPVFMDTGAMSILKGSFVNASFLGESMMIMMLIPFVANPKKILKPVIFSICIASMLAIITAIMVVSTFGIQIGSTLYFPYFSMVRFINYLDFIQNMDVWIVFIWIFSVFVKLSIYLFINSYGTAQLLGVKKWRKMIAFTAPVIFAATLTPANLFGLLDFANLVWIRLIFPIFIVGFPIIFLFASMIRKRMLAAS